VDAPVGSAAMDGLRLIVGLGNPGPKYENTRHNIGFMVADVLAGRVGGKFGAHKRSNSDIVQARLDGRQVIIAKPRTYMNLSGGPVASLAKFFSVDPSNIVVIHDELDLDFETIRLKQGGGENGHNGLRSTSSALGTKDYVRAANLLNEVVEKYPDHPTAYPDAQSLLGDLTPVKRGRRAPQMASDRYGADRPRRRDHGCTPPWS
jgi:aminoacyl-tRNA hydrolase